MEIREYVPLAPHTTFGVGGAARFFIEADTDDDVRAAIVFARERELPLFVLGAGSNVLVGDAGFEGVVLRLAPGEVTFEDTDEEGVLLISGAGTRWDAIVDAAGARGLWGIENLAGIPGTLGGATVQNIGAYGAELAGVFAYAEAIDRTTGELVRVTRDEASFGYRESRFKRERELVVTRVALRLVPDGAPTLEYPDLARARDTAVPLSTPTEIAAAVRAIRAEKLPPRGTAGSFFKNPIIARARAAEFGTRFPGLLTFDHDEASVKVSLAWLLDHALGLRGYASGNVRLYEKQPLVLVAREGASAREIDTLAQEVAARVYDELGIAIEREVEMIGG